MKKLLTVFCLFSLFTAGVATAHETHGQPQYGGVVAEAGMAQFEIVAKDGKLIVYVSNHGAPVDTTGASGKLTVLAGSAKSEIELKPAGDNRLQGTGSLFQVCGALRHAFFQLLIGAQQSLFGALALLGALLQAQAHFVERIGQAADFKHRAGGQRDGIVARGQLSCRAA